MKKMLFTAVFALIGFMASAQFMVTLDVDTENFDTDSLENVTETIGFGYFINDSFVVGLNNLTSDDISIFGRYYYNESIYALASTTTENFSDNLRIGAGYSFAAYGSFFVEPNYSFLVTEDASGERNGKFNIGLAYRF
jgi:opacity protein-like surface antigen